MNNSVICLQKLGQFDAINQWVASLDLHIFSISNALGTISGRFAELEQILDALAARVIALATGICSASRVSGFPAGRAGSCFYFVKMERPVLLGPTTQVK